MQAAIVPDIITSGIGIMAVPTILIMLMPLIDNVLSEQVLTNINNAIDNVEYFIGSNNTNLMFALLGVIIIMLPLRRIFRFFKN